MTKPRQAAKTPVLLTVAEAAAILRVTRQCIYQWIGEGYIASVKLRGCRRINEDEVKRLIKEGTQPAT